MKEYQQDPELRINFNHRDLPKFNPSQVEMLIPKVRKSYQDAVAKAEEEQANRSDWRALKEASKKYEAEQGKAGEKLSFSLKDETKKTYARGVWIRVDDSHRKEAQGYKFATTADVSVATSRFLKTDTSGIVLKNAVSLQDELVLMLQPRVLKLALDQKREEKSKEVLGGIGYSRDGDHDEAINDLKEKLKNGGGII